MTSTKENEGKDVRSQINKLLNSEERTFGYFSKRKEVTGQN